MRRLFPLVALLALAACIFDPMSPKRYPDVTGRYQLDGSFDEVNLSFGGNLVLQQPNLELSLVNGTATVALREAPVQVRDIYDVDLGTDGRIAFNVGSRDGTSRWRFTGVLQDSVLVGTHRLTTEGEPDWHGSWRAARLTRVASPPASSARP